MNMLKTWSGQLIAGLVGSALLSMVARMFFPYDLYPDTMSIMDSNPRGFLVISILGLILQVVFIVGLLRMVMAMIRKFRSFAKVPKDG